MPSPRRKPNPIPTDAPAPPGGAAERLYRLLLWLYPAAHRREYGGAMAETFARRAAEVSPFGRLERLRFVAREAGGLIAGALGERFGVGRRGGRVRSGESAPDDTWSTRSLSAPRGMKLGKEKGPNDAAPGAAVSAAGAGGGPGDPRSPRPLRRLDATAREVGHALRRLRRSPGFTLAAVMTLAIGIGGNGAVFALVNSIMLSPLPYPDADRLVRVAANVEAVNAHGIEIPIGFWLGYRELNETFDDIGLYEATSVNLSGEGEPERIEAINTTGSLFDTLGVPPSLGRPLVEADEAPGAPPVTVLSHRLWMRRYGADRAIVGRTIRVDGLAVEVVGVMPQGFAFPTPETQMWFALPIDRGNVPPLSFSYLAIGRMANGTSIERADGDLMRVTRRLPELFANVTEEFIDDYGVSPALQSYKANVIGNVAGTLWVLLGSLGFVLLIACANVANLFLVRSDAHRREIGMRAALGASRADLTRYMLSESLLIGALAGVAGLALAVAAMRLLVAFGPELPRLQEVGIGAAEVGFTAAVSLVVSIAFGALPILRFTRHRLLDQLRETGGRATGAVSARRATTLLVIGQVSLALLLIFGAALFGRSFANLTRIDPGFDATGVLTFRISLPGAAYPDDERRALFYQQLVDRLEALPGVEAAGVARCLPLQGWCGGGTVSSPDSPLPPEGFRGIASLKPVSPGYFDALGIPLRSGRAIERGDYESRSGAAVLSEALAERLFPGMDALGKRVYPNEDGPDDLASYYTVVGVVGTVKRVQLAEAPAEIVYVPMVGTDGRFLPDLDAVVVAMETAGDPTAWAAAARDVVRAIDDDVPVAAVEPMSAILSRASARVVFTATLIGIAALAALLLGAVGIYGVISHSVAQRTAEIGVRMALGARRPEVLVMVLRQGLVVAVAGVALGIGGALALGRLLGSLLYEVNPTDPLILAAAAAGLLCVALLASYLPARRAAHLDPAIAFRCD